MNDSATDFASDVETRVSKPPKPSMEHQVVTKEKLRALNEKGEGECIICFEEYKVSQTITILKCNQKHHTHDFCLWDITFNRGIHTGRAFMPKCPICRQRYSSKDIKYTDITDRQKLKRRIREQEHRIKVDQPSQDRLDDLDGFEYPDSFDEEVLDPVVLVQPIRTHVFPSDTNIIYTANDAYKDQMVMVVAYVIGLDRMFYLWLAGDRNMKEAGVKWEKVISPEWEGDILEFAPFFELHWLQEQTVESTSESRGWEVINVLQKRVIQWHETPAEVGLHHGGVVMVSTRA